MNPSIVVMTAVGTLSESKPLKYVGNQLAIFEFSLETSAGRISCSLVGKEAESWASAPIGLLVCVAGLYERKEYTKKDGKPSSFTSLRVKSLTALDEATGGDPSGTDNVL